MTGRADMIVVEIRIQLLRDPLHQKQRLGHQAELVRHADIVLEEQAVDALQQFAQPQLAPRQEVIFGDETREVAAQRRQVGDLRDDADLLQVRKDGVDILIEDGDRQFDEQLPRAAVQPPHHAGIEKRDLSRRG